MSPIGFGHKQQDDPGTDAVAGEAFVLSGDSGIGGTTRWSSLAKLFVSWPGQPGLRVTHECTVVRGKELLDGTTVPITVNPTDPTKLAIRWDEVPTIEERIANHDPVIVDPLGTWQRLYTADPNRNGPIPPDPWSGQTIPDWPPDAPLKKGRAAATGWVLADAADAKDFEMRGPNFRGDGRTHFTFDGVTTTGPFHYLSWLLLLVRPTSGEPYGAYFRTNVERARFMPVLPLSIDPSVPADVKIEWDSAPSVTQLVASRAKAGLAEMRGRAASITEHQQDATIQALAQIDDPATRAEAAKAMANSGVTVDMAAVERAAPAVASAPTASDLERLEKLHSSGILSDTEFETQRARLTSST